MPSNPFRHVEPYERPWTETMVRNGCESKRPFEKLDEVTREFHRILRQDPGARPFLNVYRCANCSKFHVGRSRWAIR